MLGILLYLGYWILKFYLFLIGLNQKAICWISDPAVTSTLDPLSLRYMVASPSLFYHCYFGDHRLGSLLSADASMATVAVPHPNYIGDNYFLTKISLVTIIKLVPNTVPSKVPYNSPVRWRSVGLRFDWDLASISQWCWDPHNWLHHLPSRLYET